MRRISGFLIKRFKKIEPPAKNIKEEIEKIIKKEFNLENFEVKYQKPKLYIKTHNAALKNEIFFKQEKIKKILKEKIGKEIFLEIRFQ